MTGQLGDGAQDDGGGHPVGQVGHHLGRRRIERGKVELHRVGDVQTHVAKRRQLTDQALAQPLVDLDDVHVPARPTRRRETHREHARAAADLEHHIIGRELGQPLDHVQDVAVDQEVLTELPLARGAGAHHPSSAAALASTARSSSA